MLHGIKLRILLFTTAVTENKLRNARTYDRIQYGTVALQLDKILNAKMQIEMYKM